MVGNVPNPARSVTTLMINSLDHSSFPVNEGKMTR